MIVPSKQHPRENRGAPADRSFGAQSTERASCRPLQSCRRGRLGATLALALTLPLGVSATKAEDAAADAAPAKTATASPDAAPPTQKVAATVWTILGTSEGEGVDPELAKLKALSQPPFDSFARKQLLKQQDVELARDTHAEVTLPNGRKLRIQLLAPKADGRYRLSVSINRPGKQDYLPLMTVVAAAGDPFFVAGQKYQGGTLVIGIRVRSAS